MRLGDVSKTAIATLRCRAIESAKARPLLHDPTAENLVNRLAELASDDERAQLFDRAVSPGLVNYLALRARKYDAIAKEFIARHPSCLVVNLGCGFDTRYWRLDHGMCEYVELDLPELIDLKRQALGAQVEYRTISGSVLDFSWMARVNPQGTRVALLLAEGLLMYLPRLEVIALFGALAERFSNSRLVFETVAEKYTRGLWKRLAVMKIRRQLGYDAGAYYQFGVRTAREIESFGQGLRILGEWSYVDDPDARPRMLKYLGISRIQWTVVAGIRE